MAQPLDDYFTHYLQYARPGRDVVVQGAVGWWQEWWRHRHLDAGGDAAARLARIQGFVVTTAQLRALGWTGNDVRREVRRGAWSIPAYGTASPVVVAPGDDSHPAARRRHTLTATATALRHPGHVITGRSAAIVHGLPTMSVPDRPLLNRPVPMAATLGRREQAHVRAAGLPARERRDWFGAPVSTIARTLVEVARLDRRDGIMAADAALHEGLVTRTELKRALRTATGWPGVRQARSVLAQADPRAESPLESITRLAMHDDGFPRPELQVEIPDPTRGRTYRVDLRVGRLVVEADGLMKYGRDEERDERRREKVRETRLEALGLRVVRLIWSDVVEDWGETSARLWRELARSAR